MIVLRTLFQRYALAYKVREKIVRTRELIPNRCRRATIVVPKSPTTVTRGSWYHQLILKVIREADFGYKAKVVTAKKTIPKAIGR